MAITIRDSRPGAPPRQRNIASLVGGYVIALGCLVLSALVAAELGMLTWPVILCCVAFAAAVGIWIRVADL